jgi:L-amino acid N-acyltransferase YncA
MGTSDLALRIRDAMEQDIPAIRDIYSDTVVNSVATLDTEPPSLEQQTKWFRRHGGRFPVLVAERDGSIVGWASLSVWNDRGAYVYTSEASVYVATDHRRRGIGTSLMRALIARAQELDQHVVIARVVRTNETSLRMMRALGFQDVGTIREVGYKFDRWLDMCVLQLLLDGR